MRINVIGTSGSGKSTFASNVSRRLSIPYVQMDALYWKDQWQVSDESRFFSALEQVLDQPHWILDGNYNRARSIKWRHVDVIVWLDYGFVRTLYQAVTRAVRRAATQEPLWGTDNTESFRKSFFSRDSIVVWTLKTFHGNRLRYTECMKDPNNAGIRFVRLRSPAATRKFASTLHQQWIEQQIDLPSDNRSQGQSLLSEAR